MHVYWPSVGVDMTPASPEWRNPYGDESEEEEPLEWDTRCPFITADNLYGSSGLEGFGQAIVNERKKRDRRRMLKVGLFMGAAAGALFLLASDVLGLKGK
jgi:hypothetical protein